MTLVRNKTFGVVFWLIAFAAVIAGAVAGGKIGNAAAPDFGDGSGASATSHLLFAAGGTLFCGGLVVAIFAGIWMAMWAQERRVRPDGADEEFAGLEALDFDAEDVDTEGFAAEDAFSYEAPYSTSAR